MSVSRRRLLRALPVAAVAVPLHAQAPIPQEASAQSARTPADSEPANPELEGARRYLRIGAQLTRQVELPLSTEPALRFVPRG